jgi:sec-independent protein translocase protein TatB
VFGLSGEKILILLVIAVFVLGPDRLPQYAQQLARLVKSLRRMAEGAKDQLKSELGEDYNDLDWRKLDPRQYDPRRIIREALLEDLDPKDFDVAKTTVAAAPLMNMDAPAPIAKGEKPPFDNEAT